MQAIRFVAVVTLWSVAIVLAAPAVILMFVAEAVGDAADYLLGE